MHVSPEGRSSEVAGARLAWRDKIFRKSKRKYLLQDYRFRKFQKQRKRRKLLTIAAINGYWLLVNVISGWSTISMAR